MLEIEEVLRDIASIERIIRPYEGSVPEVPEGLEHTAAVRELLRNPTKANVEKALERVASAEELAERYRGQGPADQVLRLIASIREKLTKAK